MSALLRPSFFIYPKAEICTSDTVKCSGANLDHHDLCELPQTADFPSGNFT